VSAYIVNPEHLGILAAYAAFHRVVISAWSHDQSIQAAQQVAIGLAKENVRYVAQRYQALETDVPSTAQHSGGQDATGGGQP
jgi:hypothetical protein